MIKLSGMFFKIEVAQCGMKHRFSGFALDRFVLKGLHIEHPLKFGVFGSSLEIHLLATEASGVGGPSLS